ITGVVAVLLVVLRGEITRAHTEVLEAETLGRLWRVSHLRLPLAGPNDARRGIADLGELRHRGCHQERYQACLYLLFPELSSKRAAVREVPTTEDSIRIGGSDLADERSEIGSSGVVALKQHDLEPVLLGVRLGRVHHVSGK